MKLIYDYIDKLSQRYSTGVSTEHSYRGDLQNLLEVMFTDVTVTNEPRRVACGAPDYIISKGKIDIGYIEAKDIGKDLKDKSYKEQFDRYKSSLPNLIFTDYMDFHFYCEGELQTTIKIAEVSGDKVIPIPENFQTFQNLIADFVTYIGITVKSADKLSKIMAGKARMMADVIEKSLTSDVEKGSDSSIKDQYEAFKKILIEDITEKQFSDVYSQTIAYGMFAARLHDESLEDFSRQEAAALIPKSNPFLRKLFQYIAGYDLDDRLVWIVDSLADVFRATDIKAILANFGRMTQRRDPIIHFYETFLAEYDPKLRKSRGVWYTPEPVVQFIVRAVDDILKDEFGLKDGLADISKVKIEKEYYDSKHRTKNKMKKYTDEVHKVQILDPATGTGTFLAEVIKQIYSKFKGMQGVWSSYVEKELIPRVNGFEILMASYAMAHLKLELLLKETGYSSDKDDRLRVYLTNSLEEHHPFTGTVFTSWLSNEANEANYIKRDTPVMVMIGNPPYSVSSSNKGKWITDLLIDYKKDLNERNIQPLSDDYIKFIRYGEHFINRTGVGVLAFISNNSFIDGLIHRQMRKRLLESFDKIYILDLHGNSKKKETCPDGSKDENVFDIQQGVSINLFIKKKSNKNELAEVYFSEIFGRRKYKYSFLEQISLKDNDINWQKLEFDHNHFFTLKSKDHLSLYKTGFSLVDLFGEYSSGVKTHRDNLVIDFIKESIRDKLQLFYDPQLTEVEVMNTLKIKNTASWNLKVRENYKFNEKHILAYSFRPFDNRYIYYSTKLIDRPRTTLFKQIHKDNYILLAPRQAITEKYGIFITNFLNDINFTGVAGQYGAGLSFPLYLMPDEGWEDSIETRERTPNLDMKIVGKMAKKLKLEFTNEKEDREGTFAPIDILDYIYAILYSPSYREKYKEFLKIDFPRVPYPDKADKFWQLVKLGSELRSIHLLESPKVTEYITEYPESGDNIITTKIGKADFKITDKENNLGRLMINDIQYFDKIPVTAWEFYIGGYQPAQKWLKDRKGRELSYEDIAHYQKIIVALYETHRLMKEIDNVRS